MSLSHYSFSDLAGLETFECMEERRGNQELYLSKNRILCLQTSIAYCSMLCRVLISILYFVGEYDTNHRCSGIGRLRSHPNLPKTIMS